MMETLHALSETTWRDWLTFPSCCFCAAESVTAFESFHYPNHPVFTCHDHRELGIEAIFCLNGLGESEPDDDPREVFLRLHLGVDDHSCGDCVE